MKLSRTVGYALQATLLLAEADPNTPIPCSRLAAQGHMPERFLLQVLRNLVTHGILHSTRGVDGGYSLERKADDISLLDLMEAVDGQFQTYPLATEGLPSESLNHLSRVLHELTELVRQRLAQVKISSLVPRRRKAV
jgi:Rrf2 family protein